MTARPVVRSVASFRARAIQREGKHISQVKETQLHHDIASERVIKVAGRNARAAAKLAAALQASYEELLIARTGVEKIKARR